MSFILITATWIIVWTGFYLGGTRKQINNISPELKKQTSLVLILIFIFYSILYANPTPATISTALTYTAYILLFCGALFAILARWEMKNINVAEVMYGINRHTSKGTVYRFSNHPMYVGFFLILGASYLLLPNVYALVPLMLIYFPLRKKIKIESAAHATPDDPPTKKM